MKTRYLALTLAGALLGVGFLVPEPRTIPVAGASRSDWNENTFWYEPWGTSGVHKGIDIFAAKGQAVVASSNLLVVYRGELPKGGKVIVALGPKWRIHYFAHLAAIDASAGRFVAAGDTLGAVGDSGNAKGKPAHLHFSLVSLLPRPWAMDGATQGYKKAFFMNPITYFVGDDGGAGP